MDASARQTAVLPNPFFDAADSVPQEYSIPQSSFQPQLQQQQQQQQQQQLQQAQYYQQQQPQYYAPPGEEAKPSNTLKRCTTVEEVKHLTPQPVVVLGGGSTASKLIELTGDGIKREPPLPQLQSQPLIAIEDVSVVVVADVGVVPNASYAGCAPMSQNFVGMEHGGHNSNVCQA